MALKYALTAARAPVACVALSTWLEPDAEAVRATSPLPIEQFLSPLVSCLVVPQHVAEARLTDGRQHASLGTAK